MAYVLVTKSGPDATRISDAVTSKGHDAVLSALLEYQEIATAQPDAKNYDAVVFTSAAAVHFSRQNLSPFLHLPAFAVGDATAAAAQDAGFADIRIASGDGASLAMLIRAQKNKRLLHLSGQHIAFDLDAALSPDGFNIDRIAVYETFAAPDLSPEALTALKKNEITHILFFSPRSAGFFGTFIERHDLSHAIQKTEALCLSQAVACRLGNLPFRKVKIAGKPATDALLALIND